MKKYIAVPIGAAAHIARTFKVTSRTVTRALHFEDRGGDTPTAKRVRRFALQIGGEERYDVAINEVFFDSKGNMIRYFANGAVLTIVKGENRAYIERRGEVVREYNDVRVSDIDNMQKEAASLN